MKKLKCALYMKGGFPFPLDLCVEKGAADG